MTDDELFFSLSRELKPSTPDRVAKGINVKLELIETSASITFPSFSISYFSYVSPGASRLSIDGNNESACSTPDTRSSGLHKEPVVSFSEAHLSTANSSGRQSLVIVVIRNSEIEIENNIITAFTCSHHSVPPYV
ncbi:hypothetical protein L1987_15598 [Smallanthus sonchifolius]|uniref:Uncharacterized protein n=1 Tax=Smallanthus sonchifolius TaxID=185202 RepID=A0ACB9J8P3_9ASTR|nr:hypothetical protein L1987_15598 [Smallanthus sonchifolius]